jgi:hypothetical protein
MTTFLLLWAATGCKKDDPRDKNGGKVELEIFEPEAGAMVDPGRTMVRGKVEGLEDLELNGERVEVDGNLWEAEIDLPRGITTFEIAGEDETGHRVYLRQSVLAGDFRDSEGTLEQGIGIRLNEGGLNAATGLVGDLLDPEQINAILPGINPVYQDAYGVFGLNAVEVTANLQGVWFNTPRITLEPGGGALEVEVILPDLYVLVPAYGQAIGFDFDEVLTLTATQAVVTGYVELGATEGGSLEADLRAPTVELRGFYFDTTLLPGSVEDWLLSDTIQTTVQDLLIEQISTMVPSLLDEQLAALKIEFETELLGKQLALAAAFDTVSIDRDGVLLIADLDLEVDGPFTKDSDGWLASGADEPRPSTSPDLAVQLSDDVVNKMLHELWRGGLLDMGLSTEDGSLDAFMLEPLGANGSGAIQLDARLPPVLIQGDDGLELQLGELIVEIETPGGDNGDFLEIAVGGKIGLEVALSGGALGLDLGSPELAIMVRDNGWGASDESITNILEEELPIDVLLALVGNIEIPMPTLGELTIPDAEVGRDEAGVFTTIDMNF